MGDATSGPSPVSEEWDWQFEGLCRTVSPELFFHPEGERGSARRRRDERARQLCLQCPVLQECRTHALAAREPYGVWGAMTEEERAAILAGADITPAEPATAPAEAPDSTGSGTRTSA